MSERRSLPPVRKHVWTIGRLLLLTVALVVTYGISFVTSLGMVTRAREVKVPDLRGKPVADATAALEDLGLTVKIDPVRRADPKVPADAVLAQTPDPGAVLRRDRSVSLRLSDGQRDPVVPLVMGQPERTAEVALLQAGIGIAARIDLHTTDYDPDVVVSQDPPAKGRAKAVTLLVNRGEGERTFVMPDVIGAPGARAADLLRSQGFRVASPVFVNYPGLQPNVVVHQLPAPGLQIAPGQLITLEVSR